MCQIHGIMKVTHTMVFLRCPQVFKHHWLPGFHIVVRIEGGFSLTSLLKSFYTLEELSLCCVSFPSNDSGSFLIDMMPPWWSHTVLCLEDLRRRCSFALLHVGCFRRRCLVTLDVPCLGALFHGSPTSYPFLQCKSIDHTHMVFGTPRVCFCPLVEFLRLMWGL